MNRLLIWTLLLVLSAWIPCSIAHLVDTPTISQQCGVVVVQRVSSKWLHDYYGSSSLSSVFSFAVFSRSRVFVTSSSFFLLLLLNVPETSVILFLIIQRHSFPHTRSLPGRLTLPQTPNPRHETLELADTWNSNRGVP